MTIASDLIGCVVTAAGVYDGDVTMLTLSCPNGKEYWAFVGHSGLSVTRSK